jgi:flagellar assembly protein FliH
MLSRARRASEDVRPFEWGSLAAALVDPVPAEPVVPDDDLVIASAAVVDQHRIDEIEQQAFARGYEQGEHAGAGAAAAAAKESAAANVQGILRRLTGTIEQLSAARQDLIRRTERQLVELALTIARQVVRREVSIDRSLLVAMARAALDRLAESKGASIRLHPDDYAELNAGAESIAGPSVTIVADPAVERGGCLVECDAGWMSVGLDSQFNEITRALLGD